jgi:NAD(P)-dependent dehydrogenase (short-subunit alcohol dehydrogenase family)
MRVLITGAGRAIGAATATELTRRGHEVVATARDVALLADLDVARRLALDVTDPASIAAALDEAGELDVVVNNAAVNPSGVLEDFPIDELRHAFETNVIGMVQVVQPLLAAWRARGHGIIVNVSSVQGRVATPTEGAYSATKHALEALSESMHLELGHFGIRTLIIEPGYIAPGMKPGGRHRGPDAYAGLWEQWAGNDAKLHGSGGRPGPEIVAVAIAHAIDDPSSPVRVRVGADAEMVLGARAAMDDEQFEKAMREVIGLTW